MLCVDCEEEVADVMILEFIEDDGANAVAAPRRNRRERILFIIVLLLFAAACDTGVSDEQ